LRHESTLVHAKESAPTTRGSSPDVEVSTPRGPDVQADQDGEPNSGTMDRTRSTITANAKTETHQDGSIGVTSPG
jgi:hypothetical protein